VLKTIAALAGAVAVLASTSWAIPPSANRHISWADERHGWVPNHRRFACADAHPEAIWEGTVCSTEDGRTWQTIFRGGNYIFVALRTSVQAGVVSTGAYGHSQFWTRDNGRHWFGTNVVASDPSFGAPPPLIVGRGNHLYWAIPGGTTVNRVTPWPPTGDAICSGQWAWSAFTQETVDADGNHCQGPAVEAGMQSRPVATVSGATLEWLARAPEGFVAVYSRPESALGRRLSVAIHRRGVTSKRLLPVPAGNPVGSYGLRGLSVSWPVLTVRALGFGSGASPTPRLFVWQSRDGGLHWRLLRRS
jgi:hypothetical protein